MPRTLLLLALLFSLAGNLRSEPPAPPLPPLDMKHLPWADGETLTYTVSWTGLYAAQGIFSAHDKSDHWQFNLDLSSLGMVNQIYPFTSTFWCIVPQDKWGSTEYGEYRFEPKRTIKERTRIDYAKHQGTREIWSKGETKTFPLTQDSIDDVGTMLYHLRGHAWQPGEKYTLYVYENNSEKQGDVTCEGRETRAFGQWPAQPLLRIKSVPTVNTRRQGFLTVWMTDDPRHLVLHAELEFRYGTFSMDLTKADKTLPIAH